MVFKTCATFGHREIEEIENLRIDVIKCVDRLIKQEGYGVFLFGGFGVFDELVWKCVTELKEKYPFIKRVYCLSDPKHQIKRPKWLRSQDYEEFIYLDLRFDWWYQRIYYRNIAMIDKSDMILFYVNRIENSGEYKTYEYALLKKKAFINLGTINN